MRKLLQRKALASAVLVPLALTVAGCAGTAGSNSGLESVRQPVVSQTHFTLNLNTGPGGLSLPEQRRLMGWFEAMDLRYGDRIAIDDPLNSGATRSAVETVANRFSLLVSDEAPMTPGYVNAGTVRVIITRSSATVPGCPNWSGRTTANFANATSANYGCATNSNLATMVADPEHLIHGATGKGQTVTMSSSKAIQTYRDAKPTGENGLKAESSKGN